MIYFDEHNRLHIVDENGWWAPSMLPNLLSELYSALADGAEDGHVPTTPPPHRTANDEHVWRTPHHKRNR